MIKEDLIKQFDAMTNELYGDSGFSEVIDPKEICLVGNYRKKRIGYTKLDAKLFDYDWVNDFVFQPLEVVYREKSKTETSVSETTVNLYFDFTELKDFSNAQELMLNYIIKMVLKFFPDANYSLESNYENFFYVFDLN